MAKVADTSRYGMMMQSRAKRRAIIDEGMLRSQAMRDSMTLNINRTAAAQVVTTEMQLRSNAQAAAKAKSASMSKLNKLA